jgi:hypothetical protein
MACANCVGRSQFWPSNVVAHTGTSLCRRRAWNIMMARRRKWKLSSFGVAAITSLDCFKYARSRRCQHGNHRFSLVFSTNSRIYPLAELTVPMPPRKNSVGEPLIKLAICMLRSRHTCASQVSRRRKPVADCTQ